MMNKDGEDNEIRKDKNNKILDPDLPNGSYFIFPSEFIGDLKDRDDRGDLAFLSGNAVKVYLLFKAMKNYGNNKKQVFPGYEYISIKTGIKSNQTIAKAILELVETGWIENIQRNGFSSYNKYFVNSKKELNDDLIDRKHREKQVLSERVKKAKARKNSNKEENWEYDQNKDDKQDNENDDEW